MKQTIYITPDYSPTVHELNKVIGRIEDPIEKDGTSVVICHSLASDENGCYDSKKNYDVYKVEIEDDRTFKISRFNDIKKNDY